MKKIGLALARWTAMTGLIGFGSLGLAASVAAQLPPVPEALEQLEFLVGEWDGEGWMEYEPGRRASFRGTERVERRMGGRLIVVEGDFRTWMGPERGEVPVHQALGIFSYDRDAGGLSFRTYTADGRGGLSTVEVGESELVWGFDDPQYGRVRFTITLTSEGHWHEVGHASRDGGASWHQFFEMTLMRK